MRILSLICLTLLGTVLFAQNYKAKYAKDLTDRLQYIEAYPVWAELATAYLDTKKGESEYLRMAARTAYYSEQYEMAYYWDSILLKTIVLNVLQEFLLMKWDIS